MVNIEEFDSRGEKVEQEQRTHIVQYHVVKANRSIRNSNRKRTSGRRSHIRQITKKRQIILVREQQEHGSSPQMQETLLSWDLKEQLSTLIQEQQTSEWMVVPLSAWSALLYGKISPIYLVVGYVPHSALVDERSFSPV